MHRTTSRALRGAIGRSLTGLALAGAACAPAPGAQPARPPPAPAAASAELTADEAAAFAELLLLEDERAYEPSRLVVYAASSAARVRARTALALGRLRRTEAIPLLGSLLADPDTAVAATAAFALGQIADGSALPALAAVLSASDTVTRPTVAAEAASALGALRSRPAHLALLSYLDAADPATAPPEIAGAALLAVWRFPFPFDPATASRWLAAPDPGVRWRAAYALVRRRDPRSVALLVELAADRDPAVRSLAIRGLTPELLRPTGIAPAEIVPLVSGLTEDEDYAVRINAIRGLGEFDEPRAVATLQSVLGRDDGHDVATAIESLGRLGPAALGAAGALEAIAASGSAHIYHRQTALESLARVAPARGADLAHRLAGSPQWRLRAASARALASPSTVEIPQALRALTADPDGRVAGAALQALVDARGDSIASLRSLLIERLGAADPFVRAVALGGLARVADPATLPILLDAYDAATRDSVPDAALAALDALAALRGPGRDPARAFFARFPRSPDYLVRRKADEIFGARAVESWGAPFPLETGRPPGVYGELVRRWSVPGDADARGARVDVVTDLGTIRVRLFGDDAPLTNESFLSLAGRGYFDGQEWPRVVTNFVVQGGDPRGDTNGGPGYVIRDEINRRRYGTGTVGMALSGPDTGGSQFFITHSPQPHLDGIYTVFGEVVQGMHLVERLLPGDSVRSVRPVP